MAAPYTLRPQIPDWLPAAPSVRSATLPPVVAPGRGRWGWRKAALPPAATPQSYLSSGQGTYPPVHGANSTIGRIR